MRTLVVGAGAMGAKFAAAIHAHPALELAGVVDLQAGRAHALAAEYGVPAWTALAAADGSADAVYLGSPSPSHADQIVQALSAGLHVLVDKPMCLTTADALRVRSAVRDADVRFMVGFSYRFRDEWRQARDWILAGRIGQVRIVSDTIVEAASAVPAWYLRPLDGGGVADLQAPHCVDRLRWMSGEELEVVSAVGEGDDQGSRAVIAVRTRRGIVGQFSLGFATGYDHAGVARFIAQGDAGHIEIDSVRRCAELVTTQGVERIEAAGQDWLGAELDVFAALCAPGEPTFEVPDVEAGFAAVSAVEKARTLIDENAILVQGHD